MYVLALKTELEGISVNFDAIGALGLVVSFVLMLNTMMSKFSVEEALKTAKSLHEAAKLFHELEQSEHQVVPSDRVVYSNDALVAYKKSLIRLHTSTLGGHWQFIAVTLFSIGFTAGFGTLSYLAESAMPSILLYLVALFGGGIGPLLWGILTRYFLDKQSEEISVEERSLLLGLTPSKSDEEVDENSRKAEAPATVIDRDESAVEGER